MKRISKTCHWYRASLCRRNQRKCENKTDDGYYCEWSDKSSKDKPQVSYNGRVVEIVSKSKENGLTYYDIRFGDKYLTVQDKYINKEE